MPKKKARPSEEFDRFKEVAAAITAVPREEVERRAKAWEKYRRKINLQRKRRVGKS